MKFALSRKSKKRRRGVDHKLIEISDLAITLTVVDFGHPKDAGVRTQERQNELFRMDLSSRDGYVKLSKHQMGLALDFYAFVDGKASWEHHHMAMVGAAFLQAAGLLGYSIKWGGLWKRRAPRLINGVNYGWDMPHIELVKNNWR